MRHSHMAVIGGALLARQRPPPHRMPGRFPLPPPGRTYAFDVASVKPSAPDERLRVFDFQPTGQLVARNQTLRLLIAMAYGTPFPVPLPDERIVGGPAWMGTARFAVEARSASPPVAETAARDIGFMLRTLLTERFGLGVRLEPRPQRVYALVRVPRPAKRRVTLRPSQAECLKDRCGIGGGPGRLRTARRHARSAGAVAIGARGPPGGESDRARQVPSTDRSSGPRHPKRRRPSSAGHVSQAPDPQAGASIFTALEEQLGLKLSDARAPIETVVITHAERPSPD